MFGWRSSDISVYDWSGYKGSLLQNVVPSARRVSAKFDENPERLARRLPRHTKQLIVHLDISDNAPFIADPQAFRKILADHGVDVLNNLHPDIRKRTVQASCKAYGLPTVAASQHGDADELLIVKTDLNAGGSREQQLSAQQKMRFNLPPTLGRLDGRSGYFVKRRGDIEADVWRDPHLVVERYLTNALGRFFRIYIAGSAVVISEAYDTKTIKRMGGDIRRHNHQLWRHDDVFHAESGQSPLSPSLLRTAGAFAHRFQLDYGALDVVENRDDEFHIVDVNKTPYWGDEVQPGMLEHLRRGFAADSVRQKTLSTHAASDAFSRMPA